jgi:hypothetical protein
MPAVAICLLSGILLSASYSDTIIDQSLKDWDRMEKKVAKKEERLKDSPEKAILLNTLHNLDSLRESIQRYGISYIDSSPGYMSYDIPNDIVYFNIQKDNVANFIHETTHGAQFQQGEIVFRDTLISDRKTIVDGVGDDLDNELEAYRAQFAYDRLSVADLPDKYTHPASLDGITGQWLLGLTNADGYHQLYMPNGREGIAAQPINIFSTKKDMEAAYPLALCLKRLGNDYVLGNDPHYLNYPGKLRRYRYLNSQTARALPARPSSQPLPR